MLEQITCWDNLLCAYHKASIGKRGRQDVALFEHALEENLSELRQSLLTKRYHPLPYHSFYIHEPKHRLISAAPFRDRVVHHALCNVIAPIFEQSFIDDSYANRSGKGSHKAVARTQYYLRRHRYVLQLDIRQFFPSIDHTILKEQLSAKVHDTDGRWLIGKVIDSGVGVLDEIYGMVYFPGDDIFSVNRPRGLPIGNLTSQFWANVYLNSLDHFIRRELRCPGYLRYVDDMVLFADDKKALWKYKEAIIAYLEGLRLTVHQGTHPKPVGEGAPFLGFHIFPRKKRLKRRKGIYFQRKLKVMIAAYQQGLLSGDALAATVQGWCNHVRYANTTGLRKALCNNLPKEILQKVKLPIIDC